MKYIMEKKTSSDQFFFYNLKDSDEISQVRDGRDDRDVRCIHNVLAGAWNM